MKFQSFTGIVTEMENFPTGQGSDEGCYRMFTLDNGYGNIMRFIVSSDTYFVNREIVQVGDWITGFYDADAPAILIYPPQLPAVVIGKYSPGSTITIDTFDSQLVSSDGMLKLNVSYETPVFLRNGQPFTGNLANRNLLVVYGASTRSIPAQTSPEQVIVLCY